MQEDSRSDICRLGSGAGTVVGEIAVLWEGREIVAVGTDEGVMAGKMAMGIELTYWHRTSESDKANKWYSWNMVKIVKPVLVNTLEYFLVVFLFELFLMVE